MDIKQLIDQAKSQKQAESERLRKMQEDTLFQQHQREIVKLQEVFEARVSESLRQTLNISYVWYDSFNCASVTFQFDGILYVLRCVSLFGEQSWRLHNGNRSEALSGVELGRNLLLELDRQQQGNINEKQHREEMARRRQAEEARFVRERAEREAEHNICVPLVADEIAKQRAAAWQWPEGFELTLYEWRYQTGEVDGEADYETEWSTQDCLDAGWVVLDGKRKRLDMLAHRPVVTLCCFDSIMRLPLALRNSYNIKVEGIDREYELMKQDPDGFLYTGEYVYVPVKWLQDVVNAAVCR